MRIFTWGYCRWSLNLLANYTYVLELPGLPNGAKFPTFSLEYYDLKSPNGANCLDTVVILPKGSGSPLEATTEPSR
jgi:hypothetical protein